MVLEVGLLGWSPSGVERPSHQVSGLEKRCSPAHGGPVQKHQTFPEKSPWLQGGDPGDFGTPGLSGARPKTSGWVGRLRKQLPPSHRYQN